jgi:uncharacterized protein YoxC
MLDAINIGNVLIAVIGFLIVHTLNGIKTEIKDVKESLKELTTQLTDIDKRVVKVETHCQSVHRLNEVH